MLIFFNSFIAFSMSVIRPFRSQAGRFALVPFGSLLVPAAPVLAAVNMSYVSNLYISLLLIFKSLHHENFCGERKSKHKQKADMHTFSSSCRSSTGAFGNIGG